MAIKILICFGTRPEWLKIKPLLDVGEVELLYTGQHRELLEEVLETKSVKYSINIESKSNRLNDLIASITADFPGVSSFDYVLVQGDTASSFACALAAFNKRIKVIHLEAGLRSFDLENPYPEEAYRQMLSRIASIHLCPTELSKENLIKEGVKGDIYVVGNSILDNIIDLKTETSYGTKVLITLHRRENHQLLEHWISEINDLVVEYEDLDFVFINHPNPNVNKKTHSLKGIELLKPMAHNELLKLMVQVKFIITDSGGLQEEGSFLNKKVIVCRKTTERPEGINSGHIELCDSPSKLSEIVKFVNDNYIINTPCPYGDGTTAQKIKELLNL